MAKKWILRHVNPERSIPDLDEGKLRLYHYPNFFESCWFTAKTHEGLPPSARRDSLEQYFL